MLLFPVEGSANAILIIYEARFLKGVNFESTSFGARLFRDAYNVNVMIWHEDALVHIPFIFREVFLDQQLRHVIYDFWTIFVQLEKLHYWKRISCIFPI